MTTGTPVVVSRIQNRRGTQAQFDNLYPTYPGTGPNILQPGELALCTDTRRIFMGNLNGEFVELAAGSIGPITPVYSPLQVLLPPSPSVFTPIPELRYSATPFLSLLYSLTDATPVVPGIPASPTAVGLNISKNGELAITANDYDTSLVDSSSEVNVTNFYISFEASYVAAGIIGISYSHNFPVDLTFSTFTIVWSPL